LETAYPPNMRLPSLWRAMGPGARALFRPINKVTSPLSSPQQRECSALCAALDCRFRRVTTTLAFVSSGGALADWIVRPGRVNASSAIRVQSREQALELPRRLRATQVFPQTIWASYSKRYFSSNLQIAWVKRARSRAEQRVRHVTDQSVKIGTVEDVEELKPELKIDPLGDRSALEDP